MCQNARGWYPSLYRKQPALSCHDVLIFWTSVPPLSTGLESCRFENGKVGRKVQGQGKHNS